MGDRSRARVRQDATRQFPFADHSGSVAAALSEPHARAQPQSRTTADVLRRKQRRAKEEREKFKQIQTELHSIHARPKHKHKLKHKSAPNPATRRRNVNHHDQPQQQQPQNVLKLIDRLAADPFIRQLLPADCAAEYMIQPKIVSDSNRNELAKNRSKPVEKEPVPDLFQRVEADDAESVVSSYSTRSNWLGVGSRAP